MTTIDTFMNDNLVAIRKLIDNIPHDKFDSHEFIRVFKKKFEIQYVSFLFKCEKEPFRTVNAQIATNLVKRMDDLKILKNGKVKSKSVFGNEVKNEEWLKVK